MCNHATKTHRERLVFVKGDDDRAREPDMARFVAKAGRQVTRRRFADESGLIREVYASLVESLENRVLLSGKEPRHFLHNAQVHCFHFLGVEKRKPIASQQPYEGRLFEVIDEAVEFVLGKLNRPVGTRARSAQAAGDFEMPRSVLAEAIVNAVAHRNYRHNRHDCRLPRSGTAGTGLPPMQPAFRDDLVA